MLPRDGKLIQATDHHRFLEEKGGLPYLAATFYERLKHIIASAVDFGSYLSCHSSKTEGWAPLLAPVQLVPNHLLGI